MANAYLLQGEAGVMIVDTGPPGNAPRILNYVESLGYHRSDIKTIALTHSDMGHAGNAARLREVTQAKVAVHKADAPTISKEKALEKAKHSRNRLTNYRRPFILVTLGSSASS
jgi:glyoxylase-like metal-dependent hydrolase (beta-lactamase superfamily II)